MSTSLNILFHLIEEATAATTHFQVWWALRQRALPEFYDTMNDPEYVEFFHASNSAHYKLIFVALGKVFDTDTRAAGVAQLKVALKAQGMSAVVEAIEAEMAPFRTHVERTLTIRNRSLVHNEYAATRKDVYEENAITPNEIRDLISATAEMINGVAAALGQSFRVPSSRRFEDATLNMLTRLRGSGA